MKHEIPAAEPYTKDAFQEPITIARNLEQALRLLDDDDDLKQVLGPEIVKAYCAVKREEFEAFNRVISSWEREYLLLNV